MDVRGFAATLKFVTKFGHFSKSIESRSHDSVVAIKLIK